MTTPIVTRFAPSPTGHLHIGGARTALFCWAYARRIWAEGGEGRFLLRIEDTDQARSSEDAARGILEDLAWLGIAWDDGPEFGGEGVACGGDSRGVGPFHQSQRRAIYDAQFARLIEAGLAYPAFDTPEELATRRKAAEKEKRSFIYRQPNDFDLAAALDRAKIEPHVLRFKMRAEPITVRDEVLGEVTFPYEELDDLVIRKADGFPTYHFAVVVDDALMGVTHVLRGQEHLNNTPRHIALQRALGFETPGYAHMPLIFNIDGTKMSKRDKDKAAKKATRDAGIESVSALVGRFDPSRGREHADALSALSDDDLRTWLKDKQRQLGRDQVGAIAAALDLRLPEIDVEDFRASGYLPEVLNNYLALLGWNPGMKNEDGTDLERFDMDFLAGHFSLERIGKSNSKFDRDKLLSFNADTIQHGMNDDGFAAGWLAWAGRFDQELAAWAAADASRWAFAASAAKPRARTLADARGAIAFALVADDGFSYDDKSVKKHLLKGEPRGIDVLPDLQAALGLVGDWTPGSLEAAIADFAESQGLGMGQVAQPLRVALTGAAVSPPLGLSLAIIGRDATLARLDRCVAFGHEAS
ncbi:MAG: glutamate--tRNA ligase [Phycisphaeraceae bacterium]|nr:MAG: glutamate--tRNA ligase [Phycisphaeraceae bacterium]